MENYYLNFCKVGLDSKGIFKSFEATPPEGFNFAYDVVDEIAKKQPDRRAMVWCNDNGEDHVFSYSDISRESNRAANLFLSMGIKKGDKVMLVLKRHYQFWFAITALHKIGAVGVPATNLLTKSDYVYRFNAAGVTHIVATAEGTVTETVEEACSEYGGLVNRFVVKGSRDGWVDFDTEMKKHSDTLERIPNNNEDLLLLYFTSGTTGYPKMVTHDHTYPIAHIVTAKYWQNVKADGLHLTVSETGWAKSVWGKLYGQWFLTAAVFVYDFDKFEPQNLLEKLYNYHVTSFCAPPTIYRFLIKENIDKKLLSRIEYAVTAGEALNPEVYNRFYELTGLKLMEAFGQTETTVITVNPPGTEPRPGSMGRPNALYNVDLIDEDGNSVPDGEVGEVVLRLPEGKRQYGLFAGYYKNEELTNEVINNGIYHTGDTAWRDEKGFFWYVGRTDDVIKASGYRIGPFEIESVIMEHPSVLECAVTGAPDPVRGTVVKATIVLVKGQNPSDKLAKEIQDFVKKNTAPYKYPRIVQFIDELPKTISGKIKRADIKKADNS